jgi:hypothetical protein
MAAKPPVAPRAATKPANTLNDTELEIGGGALALLLLGGTAFVIARRRRHEDEEEWYDEQAYGDVHDEPIAAAEAEPAETAPMPRHDPVAEAQPAIVAPEASAFAWGAANDSRRSSNDGSDRRPGETWVERAYRGPSPANPSASLRHRLRRAAFFDKRERDVAEGRAEPVEAGAGLPETRLEDRASERELA